MFIFKYIYKYTFNTNNTINTNNINIITKQIFGKSFIPFRPKTRYEDSLSRFSVSGGQAAHGRRAGRIGEKTT